MKRSWHVIDTLYGKLDRQTDRNNRPEGYRVTDRQTCDNGLKKMWISGETDRQAD